MPLEWSSNALLEVVEDFERLWTTAGFAEQFAAELARPSPSQLPARPHHIVLDEHHRQLVAALLRIRGNREPPGAGVDDLADSLVGLYLSRRLNRRQFDGWATAAIATIIGN